MTGVPLHVAQAMVRSTTTEHAERTECGAKRFRRLAVEAVFSDITTTFGISFVPDLFATLERKPAYLDAAWDLFKTDLDLDALDDQARRIVALAISTNARGVYLIAAWPQVFRLSPVGSKRCETILSMIRMFQAFSRYLSDVAVVHTETSEIGHEFA